LYRHRRRGTDVGGDVVAQAVLNVNDVTDRMVGWASISVAEMIELEEIYS